MTTQSNTPDVIAYWKSACETADRLVLALMGDCAGLRADKKALTVERDAALAALRETREALESVTWSAERQFAGEESRSMRWVSVQLGVGDVLAMRNVLARYAGLVEGGV